MSEFDHNQQIAERICQDLKWENHTFAIGQGVALLDGQVVAIADDLVGALQRLRAIEPDPTRGMVLEVAPPTIDVVR